MNPKPLTKEEAASLYQTAREANCPKAAEHLKAAFTAAGGKPGDLVSKSHKEKDAK